MTTTQSEILIAPNQNDILMAKRVDVWQLYPLLFHQQL